MKEKQPASHHCFICGRKSPVGLKLQFYSVEEGTVRVDTTISDAYQGYPGVVHGGVVAAILDETAGRSVLAGGDDRFFLTLTLDIKYRKPVPTEQPIEVWGYLEMLRGRRAAAKGEIKLGETGEVLAEAQTVLVAVPPEMLEEGAEEEFGWRVYED